VIDWANESHSLARKAYSHPADVRPIRQGDKLDDLYLSAHGASVRERLAQSAARTAELLESALRPPSGTCPGPPPTPCSP
jgi:hypothetical protein